MGGKYLKVDLGLICRVLGELVLLEVGYKVRAYVLPLKIEPPNEEFNIKEDSRSNSGYIALVLSYRSKEHRFIVGKFGKFL